MENPVPKITSIGQDAGQSAVGAREAFDIARGITTRRVERPRNAEETSNATREMPNQNLQEVIKAINEAVALMKTGITFALDEDTDEILVKVVETESQKLIRQIPAKEALKIRAKMTELLGMIFDKRI